MFQNIVTTKPDNWGTTVPLRLSGTFKVDHAPPQLIGWIRFPVDSHRRLEKRYLWPVQPRARHYWMGARNGSRAVLPLIRQQCYINSGRSRKQRQLLAVNPSMLQKPSILVPTFGELSVDWKFQQSFEKNLGIWEIKGVLGKLHFMA